jgi:hypothetical protein
MTIAKEPYAGLLANGAGEASKDAMRGQSEGSSDTGLRFMGCHVSAYLRPRTMGEGSGAELSGFWCGHDSQARFPYSSRVVLPRHLAVQAI